MKTVKNLCLALAALLGLMTNQAFAALLLTATHPTNFTFTVDNTLLPLTGAGATSRSFTTTAANQKVAIAFNAECSFASTTTQGWIGVDILVDDVVAKPSNSDDAMCTSDGSGSDIWTRTVMNAVYAVPTAGVHTIQVKARIGFGTGTGWLGDSSLIIWN